MKSARRRANERCAEFDGTPLSAPQNNFAVALYSPVAWPTIRLLVSQREPPKEQAASKIGKFESESKQNY
jgi:hypothetical protein